MIACSWTWTLLSVSLLCFLFPHIHGYRLSDTLEFPVLDNQDDVEIYLLQAPFPYNVPDNIQQVAGDQWNDYSISHVGVGIWDTTSGDRFSIEYVSNSFTGSLLPVLNDRTIYWNNSASIIFTNPISQQDWTKFTLVSSTNGNVFNTLVTFLQDNAYRYTTYQPVTLIAANVTALQNISVFKSLTYEDSYGPILQQAKNSLAFTDDVMVQLELYGATVESFLDIYATSFAYLTTMDTSTFKGNVLALENVSNYQYAQVYLWFQNLEICYNDLYADLVSGGNVNDQDQNGANDFLVAIQACYYNSTFAYFYYGPGLVANITLFQSRNYAGISDEVNTPVYFDYLYQLPDLSLGGNHDLTTLDIVLIAITFLAVIGGVGFVGTRCCCKSSKRRNVSFQGENIAAQNINRLMDEDESLVIYYTQQSESFRNNFVEKISRYLYPKGSKFRTKGLRKPLMPENERNSSDSGRSLDELFIPELRSPNQMTHFTTSDSYDSSPNKSNSEAGNTPTSPSEGSTGEGSRIKIYNLNGDVVDGGDDYLNHSKDDRQVTDVEVGTIEGEDTLTSNSGTSNT